MALSCPVCRTDMNEVKAEATTGYLLLLDQCSRCGGIWCDRWELFPLSAAAAENIDGVDAAALQAPCRPPDAALECPRCRARMAPFRDRSLPRDARIERCPNCEGMWLNRGELRRLKPPRPERRRPSDAEIDRIATAASPPHALPTVHDLDTAMHEPLRSLDPPDHRELLVSAAWLALRALLRLLLAR
jgi:Zn-finger nucleic acid-binding protein